MEAKKSLLVAFYNGLKKFLSENIKLAELKEI